MLINAVQEQVFDLALIRDFLRLRGLHLRICLFKHLYALFQLLNLRLLSLVIILEKLQHLSLHLLRIHAYTELIQHKLLHFKFNISCSFLRASSFGVALCA